MIQHYFVLKAGFNKDQLAESIFTSFMKQKLILIIKFYIFNALKTSKFTVLALTRVFSSNE